MYIICVIIDKGALWFILVTYVEHSNQLELSPMIRRIQLSINDANKGKLNKLDSVLVESVRVVNIYIGSLWLSKNVSAKFFTEKVETWLSARMQQALGKQALEIVKSQHKRRGKTKPVFNKQTINLDSRFLDIQYDNNSFDIWLKLGSLAKGLSIKLPARRHKHMLSLLHDGFVLKQSFRLRKTDSGYFIDVYAEKETPELKLAGRSVGYDCGYKTMLSDSDGNEHGKVLEQMYEKISRKKQGSKAFKRALVERDNTINRTINQIKLEDIREIVVEDLKNVKSGSRGKIRKQFNNKLQRWSYPKVLGKLAGVCEANGIIFTRVDPSYTSQTCSTCGRTDKASRCGKVFVCTSCGMKADADINAAVNIRNRGTCSPPASYGMPLNAMVF